MNLHFENFLRIFLHPFQTHQDLSKMREKRSSNSPFFLRLASPLSDQVFVEKSHNISALNLKEMIVCTWPFVFVKSFWKILSLILGISGLSYLKNGTGGHLFDWASLSPMVVKAQSFMAIYALVEVVFYPIYAWFFKKVWEEFIKTSYFLFSDEEGNQDQISQVIDHSFASIVFWAVPIFGETLQILASCFYLYAGLRSNLNLTRLQSSLTILAPLILLFLFIGLFTISISIVVALFFN